MDYWLGVGAQMSATAKSLIKKARAGEGVQPGAAPETKKVDTQALIDAVPEQVEKPVEEVVVEEVATEEAPVEEAAAEEVPAEDAPEKQEA